MPSFAFIVGRPFRDSLETDYAELERCFKTQSWKSVHVLAGSIVEAVLIDYLAATTNASRPAKDPLKMDLAEAIAICRAEGVLSDRTADLCTVVRSYRNLIHPGRVIRLGEEQPNESSGRVAIALVDLIVADVAKSRKDEFGLTADQIISKIERDENCLPILRHLLEEASAPERDRFLLDVLPARYLELADAINAFSDEYEIGTTARLRKAYHIAKSAASTDVLEKAAQAFVKILREGDGVLVSRYEAAFFEVDDLQYLPTSQAALIKQHVLARLKPTVTSQSLESVKGIERYLEPNDVRSWIDPMVRTLLSPAVSEGIRSSIRDYLRDAVYSTSQDVDTVINKRLDEFASWYRTRKQAEEASAVEQLKEAMTPDFPF
jgi:hypothetical protein